MTDILWESCHIHGGMSRPSTCKLCDTVVNSVIRKDYSDVLIHGQEFNKTFDYDDGEFLMIEMDNTLKEGVNYFPNMINFIVMKDIMRIILPDGLKMWTVEHFPDTASIVELVTSDYKTTEYFTDQLNLSDPRDFWTVNMASDLILNFGMKYDFIPERLKTDELREMMGQDD